MIVRVASTDNFVSMRSGWCPSEPQPSSKAIRFSLSKRPVSLLAAPRPLRALIATGISMAQRMPPRSEQFKNIVSVIIPTLNAAPELPRTLDALGNASIIREIIVADGGSRDETARIAETRRAAIVLARRGRGTQLRAGAAAASGAWLLFLHADCVPLPGWEDAVT